MCKIITMQNAVICLSISLIIHSFNKYLLCAYTGPSHQQGSYSPLSPGVCNPEKNEWVVPSPILEELAVDWPLNIQRFHDVI